jgi:predicted CXXCH cytochrome family protein
LLVKRPAAIQSTRAYDTPAGELDEASLVCLSCHDGTVARDVYAGTHAMNWSDLTSAGIAPGRTRLTNHPVGIRYPVGEQQYHSAEAVTADSRIRLPDGRIQCTTCHDPHNTRRHAGMLVISNDRSRLCLACHRL